MGKLLDINQELVKRCQEGDNEAFRILYGVTSKVVYNTIMRLLKNSEDAKDILQETYTTAFKTIDTIQSSNALISWLRKIAVNKSLNHLKKKQLEIVDIDEANYSIAEENDEPFYNKFQGVDVAKQIEQLPEGYRVVLSLYLFEDYSHQDIADEIGISLSTSKSQYMRGKQKLKEQLLALNN